VTSVGVEVALQPFAVVTVTM
jgi:hypothetical protein